MDIFKLSNQLMLGNLIEDFREYETFVFVKSVFASGLYNFICPKSEVNDFDWQVAEDLITKQAQNDFQVSYYIKGDDSYLDFKQELGKKGYTLSLQDRYLVNSLKEIYVDEFDDFSLVDDSTLPEFLKASAICFPDWETNDQFCQILFKTQKSTSSIQASNFLIKRGDTTVGICSHIYSQELNLSYQTNIGTLPEYRGQGVQKRSIRFLCNQALGHGITNSSAIVEPGSISYGNYQKVGFHEIAAFDVFSKYE